MAERKIERNNALLPSTCIFNLIFDIIFRNEPEHEKNKINKNTGLTMKTPSDLNRILDSSCALLMGSQGPKASSREQRILLK